MKSEAEVHALIDLCAEAMSRPPDWKRPLSAEVEDGIVYICDADDRPVACINPHDFWAMLEQAG
jgi:hypothetical protein